MTRKATIHHVGRGPNARGAYVVLDERGKYITTDFERGTRLGAFLFSIREAQAIAERYRNHQPR